MSILLAGKCGEDNNSLPDDNLLEDAKNRGGLWKVKSDQYLKQEIDLYAVKQSFLKWCKIVVSFPFLLKFVIHLVKK